MAPLGSTRMAGMSFWLDLRQPLRCAYRTDAATQECAANLSLLGVAGFANWVVLVPVIAVFDLPPAMWAWHCRSDYRWYSFCVTKREPKKAIQYSSTPLALNRVDACRYQQKPTFKLNT